MTCLDFERLEQLDPTAYQSREPYPWVNPEGLLSKDGFRRLHETLPDVSAFDKSFGKARRGGQKSHDRYTLEYKDGLALSDPWQGFLDELRSDRYRDALRRLLGVRALRLSFHWHYAPSGCSVSPHCDAPRKLGSHIFYFNTADDWDPSWGGETVVLDDDGRFHRDSAPEFEDFDSAVSSESIGNWSLIFSRRGNSWHGVREVRCPEGAMRKVFIVVINNDALRYRVRNALRGQPSY